MNKTKLIKAATGGSALLLAAATLGACGDAPDDDKGSDKPSTDYLPCIVSDAGGFDDHSFNQLSYEGIKEAADELGAEFKSVESNSENDYAPNIDSLVSAGCDTIVTVGFALSAATVEAAEGEP